MLRYLQIKYDELHTFTEVIAVGTAACLLPIKSISRKSTLHNFTFNDGFTTPGPCCKLLSERLDDIMRGRVADPYGWCVKVTGEAVLN
jgi:branched-chain amino acid aminotransferase